MAPAFTLVAALIADIVLARVVLGRRGPAARLGDGVAWIEKRLNRPQRSARDRALRGAVVLVGAVVGAALIGHWFEAVAARGGSGMRALQLLVVLGLLDAGSGPVEARLAAARLAPAGHAQARGAIERLALRLADGAIGPAAAYLLFGLGGLAAFRAVVLLERVLAGHAPFDAAARAAYRVLMWPAGLLAGVALAIAAVAVPGAKPLVALGTIGAAPQLAARAALAGACGFSLADGRGGWLGPADGRARLGAADVERAAALSTAAVLVAAGVVLMLGLHA